MQIGAQLSGLALLAIGCTGFGESDTTAFARDRPRQAVTQDGGHVGGLNFLGWLGYQIRERHQHVELERAAYFLCTGLAAPFHVSGVGVQQLGKGALSCPSFLCPLQHIQLGRFHRQTCLRRRRFQLGVQVQVGDAFAI
ncbi:hypothetical protein D3C77_560280 [compost metagenome]